jgi:5-methylcytosine-specific restriction endonuclease McrA
MELLDENLRIACLMRDGYTCQQCGKRKGRLEAHHIVFRENGGKDTLTNLLTLCEACHHHLHEGKITQRTMQGKSHLYATLST